MKKQNKPWAIYIISIKLQTENGCTKATLYYFSNKSNGKAFKEIKKIYNQANITYDNLTSGAI